MFDNTFSQPCWGAMFLLAKVKWEDFPAVVLLKQVYFCIQVLQVYFCRNTMEMWEKFVLALISVHFFLISITLLTTMNYTSSLIFSDLHYQSCCGQITNLAVLRFGHLQTIQIASGFNILSQSWAIVLCTYMLKKQYYKILQKMKNVTVLFLFFIIKLYNIP